MRRAGWKAIALTAWLAAPAAADDVDWRPAAGPPTQAEPPKSPAAWKPTATPPVPPAGDAVWKPVGTAKPAEAKPTAAEAWRAACVSGPVESPRPGIVSPVLPSPVLPPFVLPTPANQSPAGRSTGPLTQAARLAPLARPEPPARTETRVVSAVQPDPVPVPDPKPLAKPRPLPADAPPAALAAPLPASTESTSVWGCVTPAAGVAPVPVRHGTFGSANLRLSRDYHLLDAFAGPLGGESERMILGDEEAAPTRGFVQAEYLLWWVNRPNIPVLASTASGQNFGFLGTPGTTALLGPGGFGPTLRSGFRVRAGAWFDAHSAIGIDGSYFFLGRASETRRFNSAQFPTIARPFFAPNFGQEFAELVAFPGLSTGALEVKQHSELWGADANVKCALVCGCDSQLAAFAGYRHLNLRESLSITEFITAGPNAPDPVGTSIVVNDTFSTRNQFHGGQVGLAYNRRVGRFGFDARASVALGNTHQTLDITGTQVRTRPGEASQSFRGGLLAAGPNLGRFTRDKFSVVPEVTLNAGYFVTPGVRLYAGYNFLAWSNVIRPGDQIDRTIDLTFVPNAPQVPFSTNRPLPTFRQSTLWAQGLQFGVEFRW